MPKSSVYSFHGSSLHLYVDDNLANAYNRAMDAWFKAQKDFEAANGRKITPEEIMQGKLIIRASHEEYLAWNAVHEYINKLYSEGLELNDSDCTSNYLEKL